MMDFQCLGLWVVGYSRKKKKKVLIKPRVNAPNKMLCHPYLPIPYVIANFMLSKYSLDLPITLYRCALSYLGFQCLLNFINITVERQSSLIFVK